MLHQTVKHDLHMCPQSLFQMRQVVEKDGQSTIADVSLLRMTPVTKISSSTM